MEEGHYKAAEELLTAGANVNAALPSGETALHVAAKRSDLAFIQLLHYFKANLNATSGTEGETALKISLREKNENISQFLLHQGAKTNI